LKNKYSLKILPPVAIVSITSNRCEPLVKLLSQIRGLNYPKELFDIFLLDNASTDGTVEKIQRGFPEVHLIIGNENIGISAGFNTVIKKALSSTRPYKYIWLLDSDAEIESKTLMPLIEAAERESNIAVIGSAVYDPHQRDQLVTAGFFIDWKKSNVTFHVPKPMDQEGLFNVELIAACSSLVRADFCRKLGLWDERFWLYWGDTEWCARALRNGYRICCLGESKVWHRNWMQIKPDFSFPFALYDRVRSALLFNVLYNPYHSSAGARYFIFENYLKASFESLAMRPNFSRAYNEGVQDFLKGDFSKKDFSAWSDNLNLADLDTICLKLSAKIPKKPRIILNQIETESQKEEIKMLFQKYFHSINWQEIPIRNHIKETGQSVRMKDNLIFCFGQLLLRLLTFYKRNDVIISSISRSHIYNIAAARYTLFLNSSLNGCVLKNNFFKAVANFLLYSMKGLRGAFFDLPRSLKKMSLL